MRIILFSASHNFCLNLKKKSLHILTGIFIVEHNESVVYT